MCIATGYLYSYYVHVSLGGNVHVLCILMNVQIMVASLLQNGYFLGVLVVAGITTVLALLVVPLLTEKTSKVCSNHEYFMCTMFLPQKQ